MTSRLAPGLRPRLFLLLLLAIVPWFGVNMYMTVRARQDAITGAQADALRLTQLVAQGQQQTIESTRQLLIALLHLPDLERPAPMACTKTLEDVLRQNQVYANLLSFDPDGRLRCSGAPAPQLQSAADRPWFRAVLQRNTFLISDYEINPRTGGSVIYAVCPKLDASGRVASVLAAAIDLSWLNTVAGRAQLPPGAIIAVTDRNGTLLVRYPNPERWVGKPAAHAPKLLEMRAAGPTGTFTAVGGDGVARLFAFATLPGTLEDDRAAVAVGIPSEVVFAPVDRTFWLEVGELLLVLGLVATAIWLGGSWLIVHPTAALVRVTEQLAAGDLTARSARPHDRGELGRLAQSVDSMASALEQRAAALRLNEERYRIISELTSDYAYAVRVEPGGHELREWSAGAVSRITGYSAEALDALGGWPAIVHPDDRAGLAALDRAEPGLPPTELEFRIIANGGQLRWIHLYRHNEWDVPGTQVVRYYDVLCDVTPLKDAQEHRLTLERQLLETQRLESLGLLAGGIAHDFNNLLMGILGNATLAREMRESGPQLYTALEQIETLTHRAAELTSQMLAYAGQGRFVTQPIEFNQLIMELTPLFNASIPRHIQLVCRCKAEPALIEGDAAQIRQLLLNLVLNAAEAIGEAPGQITVAAERRWIERTLLSGTYRAPALAEGYYLCIEVSDSGCGMDEQTSARIFEPFFTTKFTGRGLGLAAVQGIVQRHGGAIRVSSAPGAGTRFEIVLPASALPYTAAVPPESSADWHGGGLILVVDDEPMVRDVTARMLMRLGFEVLAAPDGEMALAQLHTHAAAIQCVLLDMTMPPPDGLETLLRVRARWPEMRIIIASGYSAHDLEGRFVGERPSGFIQKPFSLDQLQQALRTAIGQPRLLRAE